MQIDSTVRVPAPAPNAFTQASVHPSQIDAKSGDSIHLVHKIDRNHTKEI